MEHSISACFCLEGSLRQTQEMAVGWTYQGHCPKQKEYKEAQQAG